LLQTILGFINFYLVAGTSDVEGNQNVVLNYYLIDQIPLSRLGMINKEKHFT